MGGSGGQSLAGIATDSFGNIYAAGSTTSLDFPVQNAIQRHPAGSGLLRIDGAGAHWQNLYQSGEISATWIAIDPQNSRTIYVSNGTDLRRSTDGGATIAVPGAPAWPGIFSVDGSGAGQGYILNKDGTLNSPGNPASAGDPITICATGVGGMIFNNGYAVTNSAVNVFVGGVYALGIAAVLGPVPGLPGNV